MDFSIIQKAGKQVSIYLLKEAAQLSAITALDARAQKNIAAVLKPGKKVTWHASSPAIHIHLINRKENPFLQAEEWRKAGAATQAICCDLKWSEVLIINLSDDKTAPTLFAEGMALSNYQFLKYKTDAAKKESSLKKIAFLKTDVTQIEMKKLDALVLSIYAARDLVNEPVIFLSAVQLSREVQDLGKQCGFSVTVWQHEKIKKEKMGGLLAVNFGSQLPPTFTIMEYKSAAAKNKKPIVLVGKGIVYDTGGLSLKPTHASMDRMKSDMSGAAVVTGIMCYISQMKLPIHVVALIPATDNRPGENAYTPGDIITMYSGATVEVLNTDAEGRMVLADALHYAKKLKPELVIDMATLTGAAAAAVGDAGMVCMGNADEGIKNKMKSSGFAQYERLVELPLWDEYGELIKSDVADIKNIGGPTGGAITAGKFLEHFVDYPWMHIDIAGVSFATAKKKYHPIGGTGYGVKMMVDFLENYHH